MTDFDDKYSLGAVLGAGLFGVFLGFMLVGSSASVSINELRDVQAEAIRRGHAEYVTGEDNKPVWKWKERQ